jgi:hypothetical protein
VEKRHQWLLFFLFFFFFFDQQQQKQVAGHCKAREAAGEKERQEGAAGAGLPVLWH